MCNLWASVEILQPPWAETIWWYTCGHIKDILDIWKTPLAPNASISHPGVGWHTQMKIILYLNFLNLKRKPVAEL